MSTCQHKICFTASPDRESRLQHLDFVIKLVITNDYLKIIKLTIDTQGILPLRTKVTAILEYSELITAK